jgi:hypothetical protein
VLRVYGLKGELIEMRRGRRDKLLLKLYNENSGAFSLFGLQLSLVIEDRILPVEGEPTLSLVDVPSSLD